MKILNQMLLVIMFLIVCIGNCLFLLVFEPIGWLLSQLLTLVSDEFRRLIFFTPQPVRDFFRVYDNMGLRHNLGYLQTIRNEVAKMPLEEQVKYADLQTVITVKYLQECFDQQAFETLRRCVVNDTITDLNTTAIGNLAYVAFNLPSNKETNWFPNDCYNRLENLRSGYLNG